MAQAAELREKQVQEIWHVFFADLMLYLLKIELFRQWCLENGRD